MFLPAGSIPKQKQRNKPNRSNIDLPTVLTSISFFCIIFASNPKNFTSVMEYQANDSRYNTGMEYRRCGQSGILLPVISLGFWHNFGTTTPFATARAIAHHAFDCGITHFDLANNYGPVPGAAEETLGRLMEQSLRPYRDELFIATKAGYEMWPGPYGNWGSRKSLIGSLNQSLRRMKLDYVDLFYSHRYDPETPLDETLQALADIVRQGKALYVGLSRWPREAAIYGFRYLAEQHVPCLIYQGRINLFDRSCLDSGILDCCRNQGSGFIAFSPLAQGLLTDRYLNGIPADSRMAVGHFLKSDMLTEEKRIQIARLNQLASERGQTLAEMALAWILQLQGVTSVLTGASSPEQLDKNLRCIGSAPFSPEEEKRIEEILS